MNSEPSKKRSRRFELASTIGERDYLSTLPNDCLLAVFGHCDGDTVDIMESVNQRINAVVNQSGWQKLKKAYHALSIIQMLHDRNGVALYLDPIKKSDRTLVYRVTGKGKTQKGVKTIQKARVVDKEEVTHRMERLIGKPIRMHVIPEIFWQCIRNVNEQYSYGRIKIMNKDIDDIFIKQFRDAFLGNYPKHVRMNNCTLVNVESSVLKNFILQTEICRLSINAYYNADNYHRIFTEKFTRQFSEKSDDFALSITCYDDPINANEFAIQTEHLWTPSRDFLPVICKFSALNLGLMTIDTNHLVDLIMLRFDLPFKSDVYWDFSMTRIITQHDLDRIDSKRYSVEFSVAELSSRAQRMRRWYSVIAKKSSGIKCRISNNGHFNSNTFSAEFVKDQAEK